MLLGLSEVVAGPPGQTIDELRDGQHITADAPMPGFSVDVTDLLLPAHVVSELPESKQE